MIAFIFVSFRRADGAVVDMRYAWLIYFAAARQNPLVSDHAHWVTVNY